MDCQGNPITPMCLAALNTRVGCMANGRQYMFGGRMSCNWIKNRWTGSENYNRDRFVGQLLDSSHWRMACPTLLLCIFIHEESDFLKNLLSHFQPSHPRCWNAYFNKIILTWVKCCMFWVNSSMLLYCYDWLRHQVTIQQMSTHFVFKSECFTTFTNIGFGTMSMWMINNIHCGSYHFSIWLH